MRKSRGFSGPYRLQSGDIGGCVLNAFEIDIFYYAVGWFFLQIAYFALLNFRYPDFSYGPLAGSFVLAVIFAGVAVLFLLFVAWVPLPPFPVLDSANYKTVFGCVYTNYILQPLRKNWELFHFLLLLAEAFVLVFAFPNRQV